MAASRPLRARQEPASGSAEDFPLVEELSPAPVANDVFRQLAGRPHCLFLDSARPHAELSRYSFVTADPFDFIRVSNDEHDGFEPLAGRMASFVAPTLPELPPFQGGMAGLLSYDLSRQFERIAPPATDEFRLPAIAVGLYDTLLAFDHQTDRAWIISQGFPETDPAARRRRAQQRLTQFRRWLDEPVSRHAVSGQLDPATKIASADLATQYPIADHAGLTSNFSQPDYLAMVRRAIEYIHAGDVFQVNLAQRLLFPARVDTVTLYQRLRTRNPAPFAAYFDLGAFQIASASPERFLKLTGGQVEARPIKGTRRRGTLPEADLFAGDELQASEKDRAENLMIVDLLRNDLSRVCTPDTVWVDALCQLESYQYVQHLVSTIQGRLRDGTNAFDLLKATFPGGSITGAPKVRAMQIIAQLEPTARGAYCGSLGYIGFDGSMDTNILIRTVTAGRGWWQAPVGGGIVAQSSPQREYEETWQKAEGLLRAFS